MGLPSTETVLATVQAVMLSPWLYVVLALLAVLDAFLPLVPSEAAVLLAGTYAANHGPDLALVVVAGAGGALLGDHLAYAVGRVVGQGLLARAAQGGRARRLHARARTAAARGGGAVLVAARFVPGARTALTVTMGATRFPPRRFLAVDAVACVVWATYCSGVGFLGGHVFADRPLLGVGTGMALAAAVSAAVVLARRTRRGAWPRLPHGGTPGRGTPGGF